MEDTKDLSLVRRAWESGRTHDTQNKAKQEVGSDLYCHREMVKEKR